MVLGRGAQTAATKGLRAHSADETTTSHHRMTFLQEWRVSRMCDEWRGCLCQVLTGFFAMNLKTRAEAMSDFWIVSALA